MEQEQAIETIKSRVKDAAKLIGAGDSTVVFQDGLGVGDIGVPCFPLCKELGVSPLKAAQKLMGAIEYSPPIAEMTLKGGFVFITWKVG